MQINDAGLNPSFFSDAFLDAGGYDVTVVTATATEIVLEQPTTGLRTTITGTGLVYDGDGALVEAGTVTGISFATGGGTVLATFADMSWDLAALHAGLAAAAGGDDTILNGLFSSQPITLDISAAPSGYSTALLDSWVDDYVTTFIGSAGVDYIYGGQNGLNRYIDGKGGNDQLISYDGHDTLIGGAGNDNLQSQDGNDLLEGGDGDDSLMGGHDDDTLNGGTGDDRLQGWFGDDRLDGGDGNDTVYGYNGTDTLTGGAGDDLFSDRISDWDQDHITDYQIGERIQLTGFGRPWHNSTWSALTEADVTTHVSGANLRVHVDANDDGSPDAVLFLDGYGALPGSIATVALPAWIYSSGSFLAYEIFFVPTGGIMPAATFGDDRLFGDAAANVLDGGFGNDILHGMDGADSLTGGFGDDRLVGGAGRDTLKGGFGRDYLFGSEGKDLIFGDEDDDHLQGGDHNDTLHGGDGDDRLGGGDGNDVLRGGDGSDTFFGGHGRDRIYGGKGYDVIYAGDEFSTDSGGVNKLFGEDDNDQLYGADGDDYLNGGRDDDYLSGYIGNDTLVGGGGDDTLKGDAGDDLGHGGWGHDRLEGSDGDDTLNGDQGRDTIIGGEGRDDLSGGDSRDRLEGGNGHDRLDGGGGNDRLIGGNGKDTLKGGDGDDRLIGGAGSDRMVGGAGNDILRGGPGADKFVFNAGDGQDTIKGFADDEDTLVLNDALWGGGLTEAQVIATYAAEVGGAVVFTFAGSETITVEGVASKADLVDDLIII